MHKTQHAEHERERLIAEAKEAWKKKQETAKAAATDSRECICSSSWQGALAVLTVVAFAVITDPEDPRFDLEKLIAKWEKAA